MEEMAEMEGQHPLASKVDRAIAEVIDIALLWGPEGILFFLLSKGVQVDEKPSLVLVSLMGGYCLAVLLIQMFLLIKHGQTVGKKVRGIRIVRQIDGLNGGFMTNVMLRSVMNQVLRLFPFYGIIDVLFVFSPRNRCLHDRLAGTLVVRDAAASVQV